MQAKKQDTTPPPVTATLNNSPALVDALTEAIQSAPKGSTLMRELGRISTEAAAQVDRALRGSPETRGHLLAAQGEMQQHLQVRAFVLSVAIIYGFTSQEGN